MDYGYINLILNAASVLALIAGGVIYYKSSLSANTLRLYKENQLAQLARLDSLQEELREAKVQMTLMQEELRVIKTLPLDSIMKTLEAVLTSQNAILETQNRILRNLESNNTLGVVNISNPK